MTGLSAQEEEPGSGEVNEPPDPWDVLPDPDEPPPGHEVDDEDVGAYRGRRRAAARLRTRLAVTAVVVTAVGAVLVGSGLAARLLSPLVAAPVVPPSETPDLSPSPSPSPLPLSPPPPIDEPSPVAGLGSAPESTPPSAPPEPSPEPEQPPEDPPDDPSPDPPEPVSLAFEAESAQRGGDAEVVFEQRASGDAAVDLDGRGQWCLVRFTGIAVDRDGEYELTIHYLSRWEDTVAWASANDGRAVAVGFPETSGDSVGTRTVRAGLDAGDNVITISSPSCDDAPRLDQITITD